MALVDTLKIYEMLRPQFRDEPARVMSKVIEESLEDYERNKAEVLATKEDIRSPEIRMAEMRAEIVKWMFIFWVAQAGVMTGLFMVFLRR